MSFEMRLPPSGHTAALTAGRSNHAAHQPRWLRPTRKRCEEPACYSCTLPQERSPSYYPWPQPLLSADRSLPNCRTSAIEYKGLPTKAAHAELRSGELLSTRVVDESHLRRRGGRWRWRHGLQPEPTQLDRQAARHRHDRSLAPDAGRQAVEDWHQVLVDTAAHRRPRALQQDGPQRPRSTLHDVPTIVGVDPGAVLARGQPQVVRQRTRGGKALDVAEFQHQADRRQRADPRLFAQRLDH